MNKYCLAKHLKGNEAIEQSNHMTEEQSIKHS